MSKKILKRSLALGALMAVVITGNVWAGEAPEHVKNYVTAGYITDSDLSKYGALYNEETEIFTGTSGHQHITSSKEYNNKVFDACVLDDSTTYGGAITVLEDSDLDITNCTFVDNKMENFSSNCHGGHISNVNGNVTIKQSLFLDSDKTAADDKYTVHGSAVYLNGGVTDISDSLFVRQSRPSAEHKYYGAIQCDGTNTALILTSNEFKNNQTACIHAPNTTASNISISLFGNNKFEDNTSNCFIIYDTNSKITFAAGSETTMLRNANDICTMGDVLIDSTAKVKSDGGMAIVGTLELNGTLDILGTNGQVPAEIENLKGTGGTLYFKDKASLKVVTNWCKDSDLTIYATKEAVEAVGNDVNNLIKKIDHCEDTTIKLTYGNIAYAEGKIIDYKQKFENDPDAEKERFGFMYVDCEDKKNFRAITLNPENQAIGDKGLALKLHWRSHLSDMNKRMGELRDAHGELGVWTRMVRGENEYKGTKAQYNQYQLGYDERLSVDKRWIVGTAVTFADGDASYGYGSTEDKSTAFTVYGTKLNNDGSYVDLIARYEHMESDLKDALSGSGDYCANGMSVGAEFGKRFDQKDGAWIEPQVQLTYGTVDSAEFLLGDKTVRVGDMDSLIGRIGFRIGQDIEQGNIYARASYLYDFDGKTEATFSDASYSKTVKEDLGGGWWEVGVGTNINLSKATYLYAEVDKTFGGEVDTNWQWNLGVRYSF